ICFSECGYDYECLLGEGCYGSVFKGIHREDRSKKAAIKCIRTYGVENGGTASRFRQQLLDAVKHLFSCGIFHGDLHLENVLVSESSLDLKVIDFGCALAIEDEPFESSDYHGNEIFCPPEIDDQTTFFAEPAYVWCLAAMFDKIMKACETNEWCYILRLCLARDPADRLRLHQM
ncbi:hypothetical protein DNTS_021937, partial [Danionella cerebrum]